MDKNIKALLTATMKAYNVSCKVNRNPQLSDAMGSLYRAAQQVEGSNALAQSAPRHVVEYIENDILKRDSFVYEESAKRRVCELLGKGHTPTMSIE